LAREQIVILPDRVGDDVRILFVGINPGLRSAALGHHFAGHSNRFWKLLRDAELVPVEFGFERDVDLPALGLGITNLVDRATAGVAELRREEFAVGRQRLLERIAFWRPKCVALVGVTVYRELFEWRRGRVALGEQPKRLHGAQVFVLPNPSGRNAHYSYAEMLRLFRALQASLEGRTVASR
jgi:TDG/mug DNA glycosylase family protein